MLSEVHISSGLHGGVLWSKRYSPFIEGQSAFSGIFLFSLLDECTLGCISRRFIWYELLELEHWLVLGIPKVKRHLALVLLEAVFGEWINGMNGDGRKVADVKWDQTARLSPWALCPEDVLHLSTTTTITTTEKPQ